MTTKTDEQERAAFEAHIRKERGISPLRRDPSTDAYWYTEIANQWEGWQAAIVLGRQGRGEPVKLIHMAVIDEGELRMMSGRRPVDCELYAMPDLGHAPDLYIAPRPAAPVVQDSLTVAEPVKEVSDDDLLMLARQYFSEAHTRTVGPAYVIGFARALLARYGQHAQPVASVEPIRPTVTVDMVDQAESVLHRARGMSFTRHVRDALEAALDAAQRDGLFAAPVAAQPIVPDGLSEVLHEAAEILSAIHPEFPPRNMRWPIVDELEGFAAMLAAAPTPPAADQAQQDAVKPVAEMVHAMFRSGNDVPVSRITITREQYDAARAQQGGQS